MARHPVHVTMRCAIRSLRSQFVFPTVRIALEQANRRNPTQFRICEFSVQADHIHLIVEAACSEALSSGMRGLSIRLARALNRLVFRCGRVFLDRWHGRPLRTPREVRHALAYVLANFKKHESASYSGPINPFSSAVGFMGFSEVEWRRRRPPGGASLAAESWLLREGWKRYGLISVHEAPRG
ncbi:MAG: transposase [Polyangiaceae bacterium]